MAEKIIRYLLDDYEDGKEVEADAGTVTFAFDGAVYEIDLSIKNKNKLRDQLGPWIAKGRRAGTRRTAKSTKPKVSASGGQHNDPQQLAAVREWAGRNGFTVSNKGRIPKEVMIAFEEDQKIKAHPVDAAQA